MPSKMIVTLYLPISDPLRTSRGVTKSQTPQIWRHKASKTPKAIYFQFGNKTCLK